MSYSISNVVPFRDFKERQKSKDYIDYLCCGYTDTGYSKSYPRLRDCEQISCGYVEGFVRALMECSATALVSKEYHKFGAGDLLAHQLALSEYNWAMSFAERLEVSEDIIQQIGIYLRISLKLNKDYLDKHNIQEELTTVMKDIGCYGSYVEIENIIEDNISIQDVSLRLSTIDRMSKALQFANVKNADITEMKTIMFNDLLTHSVTTHLLSCDIDACVLYGTNVIMLEDNTMIVVEAKYDKDLYNVNELIKSVQYYEHFEINRIIYLTYTNDDSCVVSKYPVYVRNLESAMVNLLIKDMREVDLIFNIM